MRQVWMLVAMLCAGAAPAELQPVRVLEHAESYAVLGNEQFSVRVESTGKFGQVQVGGVEHFWMGSLYTSPLIPETGEGLRAVQAEGGLGPAPPIPEPLQRGDYCNLTIAYDAAREEMYGGEPLYRLTQNVQVHPGGWIRLYYRFDWQRIFIFQHASLYLALSGDCIDRARYSADYTGRLAGGILDVAVGTGRIDQIRGPVRSLTIDAEAGPLMIWFEKDEYVTAQFWGAERVAVIVEVPGTGRSVPMYPGTSSEMLINIKLPVSQ